MTPAARAAALALIGWTRQEFAKRLGVHHSIVSRWLRHAAPPAWVDRWLHGTALVMSRRQNMLRPVKLPPRGRPRKIAAGGKSK
jgi:transcriptional regulator with XRE-family HTH domain